jgi:hypothetical protein
MDPAESSFYVIGGTLRADAPSYVERQADRELLGGLLKGEFCYVLTSRQMGKSSLMVRTAQKLRAQGAHVVVLDLTAIGQNLTPEQWYDGLMVRIGRQLRMEDPLDDYWMQHQQLGPVQRFFSALRDLALVQLTGPLVIFVDEIDVVRSLPFSTDEFFAAIRECFTRRAEDPELNRLAFCLMGVATPSDLIKDVRMTPFNIARRIELRDFTEAEAQPLANALGRSRFRTRRLLRRILYWTGGHPYLTQRLCQAVASDLSVCRIDVVDRICRSIFLSHRARERDDNLLFVRERLLRSEVDRVRLLRLYRKVHLTTRITGVFRIGFGLERLAPVADEETNPLVSVLRLSGITREEKGLLKVRNRIYYVAFDRDWVTAQMPEVELWRLWVMFLTGVKRLAKFLLKASFFVALIAVLIAFAVTPGLLHDLVFREPRVAAHVNRPRPKIPPRPATAPANLLDLSRFYNAALAEDWHEGTAGSLSALPVGIRTLRGIDFDVRGIVQLAGRQLANRGYPAKVGGIPLHRRCLQLHFLHATGWSEQPGRQIGNFIIHYAGGREHFIPIIYGQDVLDWVTPKGDIRHQGSAVVAWEGHATPGAMPSGARHLFLTSWQNPLPFVAIEFVDYESALTEAAPFLIAITAEP